MAISGINSVSFKGTMVVTDLSNGRDYHLDSERILGVKSNPTHTTIKYDLPQEIREKGRTYYVPKEYKVNLSTDSVLSAYNAIKDSDITVDLTESKNSLNNIRSGKLMI